MADYDFAVIGAGLIGTATAKYLSRAGKKVVLIGPSEPMKEKYDETQIFGSYFDEGRIGFTIDTNPFLAHCSRKTMSRVKDIGKQSGIPFFQPVGFLHVMDADSVFLNEIIKMHSDRNLEFLDTDQVLDRFGFLNLRSETTGVYENGATAGSINPRALVRAQKKIFLDNNGTYFDPVATNITKTASGFVVQSDDKRITARKIVITVGSFWIHNELFSPGVLQKLKSKVTIEPLIVARFPLAGDVLEKMKYMPNICFETEHWTNGDSMALYMMTPTIYPDGRTYFKIGYDNPTRSAFTDAASITDWYRNLSDHELARNLVDDACRLVKGLTTDDVVFDTCTLTYTESFRPLIAEIDENMFIFTGCCGYGATCSDEFGRLLAELASSGKWDCPFRPETW